MGWDTGVGGIVRTTLLAGQPARRELLHAWNYSGIPLAIILHHPQKEHFCAEGRVLRREAPRSHQHQSWAGRKPLLSRREWQLRSQTQVIR